MFMYYLPVIPKFELQKTLKVITYQLKVKTPAATSYNAEITMMMVTGPGKNKTNYKFLRETRYQQSHTRTSSTHEAPSNTHSI